MKNGDFWGIFLVIFWVKFFWDMRVNDVFAWFCWRKTLRFHAINSMLRIKENIHCLFLRKIFLLEKLFLVEDDGENISVGKVYLMNVCVKWVMDVYVRGDCGW